MSSNSDAIPISTQGNICFFCERLFLSEPALHKHLKTHVCDNSKPVCFCLECNPQEAVARVEEIYKQYLHVPAKNIDRTSVAYLNRLHHCKLKSFENPVYRCPQCGCVFNGLAVFVKHMQVGEATIKIRYLYLNRSIRIVNYGLSFYRFTPRKIRKAENLSLVPLGLLSFIVPLVDFLTEPPSLTLSI